MAKKAVTVMVGKQGSNRMESLINGYNNEPQLDELLMDPILRILLQYDGLSLQELMPLMQEWQEQDTHEAA